MEITPLDLTVVGMEAAHTTEQSILSSTNGIAHSVNDTLLKARAHEDIIFLQERAVC